MFPYPRNSRKGQGTLLSALGLVLMLTGGAYAQNDPPTPTPNPQPETPRPDAPQPPQGERRQGSGPTSSQGRPTPPTTARPRPYDQVITNEAKTDPGLITTHQVGEKVYFEIPDSALGKEILWVTTLRETQVGAGYGGQEVQDRVVRWEKKGDKILLRGVDYQARAADEQTELSVKLSAVEPILEAFNVAAYNEKEGKAAVVDMTPFLTGDPSEFSPRRRLGASRVDAGKTFIERVKSLPTNVELDVLATYSVAAPTPGAGGPGRPAPAPRRRSEGPSRDASTDSITALVHHSLVLLPETPMKPRLADERLGFFTNSFYRFGGPENRVKRVTYVSRWRLEKKDPKAMVSEPVKPITYYIGPEVPAKWRPFIKKGVEDWQPAFEKAGFKNGIVCKDPPSKEEDPDWDPDDVRYSVIRWFPSATENAYGPSIKDPRSGEILNANPRFYHNVLKLAEVWYFTQASPSDPKAQKLPLPEPLVGELLRYVVSHEIGHTLGLRHNMKASSAFTVAQLRDPKFTEQWGTEASIMDYGRFNYVAQPEDKVTRLIPRLGPYDYFAIDWGYRQIDADTPEGEQKVLDALASQQSKNPMLRFGGGPEGGVTVNDPGQQTEDLGADTVEATRLGLKNIDRVLGYLVPATSKPGEDYELLEETYSAVLGQRERELNHVVTLVGGFTQTTTFYQQPGAATAANFAPLEPAHQKQALRFLVENALVTPRSLIQPDLLARIEPEGVADRVLASQIRIASRLLDEERAKRMVDMEALYGTAKVYPLVEMVGDLNRGIWGELYLKTAAPLVIDPYRRNLQRAYIALLGEKLKGSGDLRALARGTLKETQININASLTRVTDRMTKLHLQDCVQTIQQILEPR